MDVEPDEDVRRLIPAEAMRLVDGLPDAVANLQPLVRATPHLPEEHDKTGDRSLRATVKLLEAAGIRSTPTASPPIATIMEQKQRSLRAPAYPGSWKE